MKRNRNVRLNLEALEDRFAPASATWNGSLSDSWTDSNNWTTSNGGRWYPGDGLHTDADAIFDGTKFNGNCTVVGTITINKLTVQGLYTGLIKLGNSNNGAILNENGAIDFTGGDVTNGFGVKWMNWLSALQANTNANLGTVNFLLDAGVGSIPDYIQLGGTLTIANNASNASAVTFDIGANASTQGTWDARNLTSGEITFNGNAGVYISDFHQGALTNYGFLYTSAENGTWLSNGTASGKMLNKGIVEYLGTSTTGVETKQSMPMQNNGELVVDADLSGLNTYTISGLYDGTNSLINTGTSADVGVTDGVFLANGVNFHISDGFSQTGGEFRTLDGSQAEFKSLNTQSTFSFTGGSLTIGESLLGAYTWGDLKFDNDTSFTNTTVNIGIKGSDTSTYDFLNIVGKLTCGVGSKLAIQVTGAWYGQGTGNHQWKIIDTTAGRPTFASDTVDVAMPPGVTETEQPWDGGNGIAIQFGQF
jgi:hypothetical protein